MFQGGSPQLALLAILLLCNLLSRTLYKCTHASHLTVSPASQNHKHEIIISMIIAVGADNQQSQIMVHSPACSSSDVV